MITKEAQIQTLLKDISRAEKAGLVTSMITSGRYAKYFGEISVVDVEVASDVLAELLGYLERNYPDVCFRQTSQGFYYGL